MEKLYDEMILEQYKLYVSSAEKVSDRRNSANVFFLTINSFATPLIVKSPGIADSGDVMSNLITSTVFVLALVLINFFWLRLIKSYRQLNTAKFKVIGDIEKKLPISPYYNMEWKELGEGIDPKLYTPLTKIEQLVPKLLIILHFSFLIYFYFSNFY